MKLTRLLIPLCAFFLKFHVARGNGSYSAHRPNILEITYEEIPEFIVLTDGSGWELNPKAGALSGERSRPTFYETLPPLDLVLTGQIQMMDLTCEADSCSDLVTECTGCRASFCMTNIDLVTSHPERYPSYMYVTDTEHCQKQAKIFDLNYIYDKVVEYDTLYPTNVNLLNLTTAFFEMGFTNTERLMQGLSIDHTKMVLVNPQPMDEAISICDNKAKGIAAKRPCDRGKVVDLVRKVNYLMCRTSNIYYEDCVVKYSTDSAKAIDIFEMAHLKASDYFVYMDPVLYIGAAVRNAEFPERALCAKHKRNPSAAMVEGFKELGKKPTDATVPELCAMEANIAFRRASATADANGRLLLLDADTLMDNVTDVANCDANPNSNICQNVQKITDLSNKDIYGTVDPNREEKRKARLEANTTPETRQSARAGLIDAFVSAGLATQMPSLRPSDHPSDNPSSLPTRLPTNTPTNSLMPSLLPSLMPSMSIVPSSFPTVSKNPSVLPSLAPSDEPSRNPTRAKICADSGTPNYRHCWRQGWRREEHCRTNYESCSWVSCGKHQSNSYCCKCGGGRWYYP